MNKDKLRKIFFENFKNEPYCWSDWNEVGEDIDAVGLDGGYSLQDIIDQILKLHQKEMREMLESMPKFDVHKVSFIEYVDRTSDWQSQKLKELGGKDE